MKRRAILKKKRLLCLVYEAANVKTWNLMAQRGKQSNAFDVIMWSPYFLPNTEEYKKNAISLTSVYVHEVTLCGGLSNIHEMLSGWLTSASPRIPSFLKEAFYENHNNEEVLFLDGLNCPSDFERFSEEVIKELLIKIDVVKRRVSFCEDWLVKLGIDAVLLPEDNIERDSYAWVKAARRRNVKSIISSYGSISRSEAVNAYSNSPAHRITEECYSFLRLHNLSHWTERVGGYHITRLPFIELLARELTATAPKNPWVINSGATDVLAVESNNSKVDYLAHGFENSQIEVIGHPLQDKLAIHMDEVSLLKEKLAAEFSFDSRNFFIVVAMPPNQLELVSSVFDSYTELLVSFGLKPSEITGFNTIVSPHPNASAEEIELMKSLGINIVHKPVSELMPIADIYLSSVSSTIKWALGLGIPVIDFDCFQYGYANYKNLNQVLTVSSEDCYQGTLEKLKDINFVKRLKSQAQSKASNWGPIDGNATSRLVQLVLQ